MVWAKHRFAYADYSPYFDRLEKLLMANATLYRQFIMVSTETDNAGVSDYYVGVPIKRSWRILTDLKRSGKTELPTEIDALHIADATTDEFKSCFRFRERQRRQQS